MTASDDHGTLPVHAERMLRRLETIEHMAAAASRSDVSRGGALARPVGFVLSEATNPLVAVNTGAGNGHHGIA